MSHRPRRTASALSFGTALAALALAGVALAHDSGPAAAPVAAAAPGWSVAAVANSWSAPAEDGRFDANSWSGSDANSWSGPDANSWSGPDANSWSVVAAANSWSLTAGGDATLTSTGGWSAGPTSRGA